MITVIILSTGEQTNEFTKEYNQHFENGRQEILYYFFFV